MPDQIPEDEERAIADALRSGKKPDQIRRETGRGKSVIYRIMDSIGLKNSSSGPTVRTKKAIETKSNYDRQRRVELNNKFFEKIDLMLLAIDKPYQLKDLAISYGIIEDKRQIIEPIEPQNKGVAAIHKFNELLKNGSQTTQPQTDPEHKGK